MGQYFCIINLDREEFLDPYDFNEGGKLSEFSNDAGGVLQALALLTSNGNGNGGGDLCRVVQWPVAEPNPPADYEPAPWEEIKAEWEAGVTSPTGYRSRILVPTLAGTWAGDRIVTAGDYGEDGKFIPTRDLLRGLEADLLDKIGKWNARRHLLSTTQAHPSAATVDAGLAARGFPPIGANDPGIRGFHLSYNLYTHASLNFKSIGAEAKQMIRAYAEGTNTATAFYRKVEELLSRELVATYPWRHVAPATARGKRPPKMQYRLHWMAPELFDCLLRSWHDPEDLKLLKAWLRKQILLPWQRNILKYYRGWRNGVEQVNFEKIEQTLATYGLVKHKTSLGPRYPFPPTIPAERFLWAALAVQAREEPDHGKYWAPFIPCAVDGVADDHVAEQVGAATTKRRIIQLQ